MNSTKQSYRDYFTDVSKYVKLTNVLKDIDENRTNFSRFMKGNEFDYYLSVEKLQKIESAVKSTLSNLL